MMDGFSDCTNIAGSCDPEYNGYNGHNAEPGLVAAYSALDVNSQALPPPVSQQHEILREDLDQSIGWWQYFTPDISAGAALSQAEELVADQARIAYDSRGLCEISPPASIWHDEQNGRMPVAPIPSDLSPHQRSPASKTGRCTTMNQTSQSILGKRCRSRGGSPKPRNNLSGHDGNPKHTYRMQAYGEDVENGEAPRHHVHLSWDEGEERAVRGFLEQDMMSMWLRISEKMLEDGFPRRSAFDCEQRAHNIANRRKRHATDPNPNRSGRLAGLSWTDDEDHNLIDLICMDWNKRWHRLKDNMSRLEVPVRTIREYMQLLNATMPQSTFLGVQNYRTAHIFQGRFSAAYGRLHSNAPFPWPNVAARFPSPLRKGTP